MTQEEERRFRALETLRKAAWESFNERRKYEFKVTFSMWTALAALIGLLMTRDMKGPAVAYAAGTTAVSVGAAALHAWWIGGISRANRLDKHIAFTEYRDRMNMMLNVTFGPGTNGLIAEVGRGGGRWSGMLQVCV